MNKKVWVLNDQWFDQSPDTIQIAAPLPGEKLKARASQLQKSPAKAFSCSLLIWGSGQLYVGEKRPGMIYLAAMLIFIATFSALAFFWDSAARYALEKPVFIAAVMIYFLMGVVVWMVNVVDAYYRSAKLGAEPFLGVQRTLWPLSASLLFPGWGQFLNGQPKKGIFFLIFGAGGVCSVVILFMSRQIWPLLAADPERRLFENFLVVALAMIPVVFLMWMAAANDAFRSCEDYLRHQQRSQMAGYRLKSREILSDFVPQCSAMLGFLLAISLGMQFIPWRFYLESLGRLRIEMLNNHMTIIPGLIQKVLGVFSW